MAINFRHRLFGNNSTSTSKNKNKRRHHRSLRIEELESRDLLSVSPFDADYDDIHALGNGLHESDLLHQNVPPAATSEEIQASSENLDGILEGLTLNITGANYEELNALYNFSSVYAIRNCSITLNTGISLNFDNCTEMVNTSLTANNGSIFRFSALTKYTTSSTSGRSWNAGGAASMIVMSALTTIEYTGTGTPSYDI
ncbi:MAG: hypothetical protein FWE95_10715, partial [Planctomycetaceae bacterium]|nr:hypothetical protein [Planctomycetaceae bacterium]